MEDIQLHDGWGIKIQLVKLNVNSCHWVIVSSEHHTSMESGNLTSIITLNFSFCTLYLPSSLYRGANSMVTSSRHRTLDFKFCYIENPPITAGEKNSPQTY